MRHDQNLSEASRNSRRTPTRRSFVASTAAAAATLALSSRPGLYAAPRRQPRTTIIGFTKPFQSMSFDDVADVVAEVGWDGIECPVRPGGQIEPEAAADELPKLMESLAKRGKELTLMTTAITSASQPGAEQLLRIAANLGIRRYRLGFPQYDLAQDIPRQLANVGAALRDLAALNKELGLQAGLQNHSGPEYVGAPIWDLWSVIKDLDPRHLGICFDIGHATIEGGLSWPVEARLMQGFFTAVFVKDFRWSDEGGASSVEWVPLGQGRIDPTFFSWLSDGGFAGVISQHHEYDVGRDRPMIQKMQQDLNVLRGWLGS